MEDAFPKVIRFNDYHEIDAARDVLRHFVKGVMASEITEEDDGGYYGLFWIRGSKPSKDQIAELRRRAR